MGTKSQRLYPIVVITALFACIGCVPEQTRNSLAQQTGHAGSTLPRTNKPYYPNTAGNIVAPPGNPAGNPAGMPPIINGTENQSGGWPIGRQLYPDRERVECKGLSERNSFLRWLFGQC